jgi:DNA-binding protein HU-beta
MYKTDLIDMLAWKTCQSKAASGEVVDAFFEIIGEALAQGDTVHLIGFGTFGITKTKARAILHPQTGEVIQLPAGRRPKFTAGAKLKAVVINR